MAALFLCLVFNAFLARARVRTHIRTHKRYNRYYIIIYYIENKKATEQRKEKERNGTRKERNEKKARKKSKGKQKGQHTKDKNRNAKDEQKTRNKDESTNTKNEKISNIKTRNKKRAKWINKSEPLRRVLKCCAYIFAASKTKNTMQQTIGVSAACYANLQTYYHDVCAPCRVPQITRFQRVFCRDCIIGRARK